MPLMISCAADRDGLQARRAEAIDVAAVTSTGNPARSHGEPRDVQSLRRLGHRAAPVARRRSSPDRAATRSTAARITSADRSTAWTLASAPSFFPRPTALRTRGHDYDFFHTKMPHIGRIGASSAAACRSSSVYSHALLRLLRAEQAEKRLALEVEDVLLASPRAAARRRPASTYASSCADPHVVVRRLPGLAHRPDAVLQVAHRFVAERRDRAAATARRTPARDR